LLPLALSGAADPWDHREDNDFSTQRGKRFRLLNKAQQKALFKNTARSGCRSGRYPCVFVAEKRRASPA
jgi:hypothetical protein